MLCHAGDNKARLLAGRRVVVVSGKGWDSWAFGLRAHALEFDAAAVAGSTYGTRRPLRTGGSALAARSMDPATRDLVQSKIGHVFNDETLLARALTHASVTERRTDSNERMEFLGDAVLGLVSCELIFSVYPDLLEGEMTKIKSTVVSRQTCATIAREMGLDTVLVLGRGMQWQSQLPQSLAAAVLEAMVAAVYLDAGLEAARKFLIPILEPLVRRAHACGHQENFKSVLQQHAQQTMGETPVYVVLDEKGPDHAKCFEVAVEIGAKRYTSCWGQSKKQAEQQAALNALRELKLVSEENGELRIEKRSAV